MRKRIGILGTLDTKGEEIGYLKQRIEDQGHQPIVIDVGVIGEVPFDPDVDRSSVALASGATIEEIASYGDEAKAELEMAKGAAKIVKDMNDSDELDGLLALGGTMGTDLALDVMAALPLGIPKLIISVSHSLP